MFSLQRAIPRKFRKQWEIGVSQATEALGLLIEERLAKFSFVYEKGKAQFNPRMLQELQAQRNQGPQQDQAQRESQELVSLTPPDSTHSSPNSTTPTTIPDLFSHPTDSSTSSGKTTLPKKAPKTSVKRDHRRQRGTTLKYKTTKASSAKRIPLTESTVQVADIWYDWHCLALCRIYCEDFICNISNFGIVGFLHFIRDTWAPEEKKDKCWETDLPEKSVFCLIVLWSVFL